ncbi:MAG: radical SAM family heme chaperone HemW [Candidatus Edwardsbacteria bacterium]|nr:radical SAM family heme chaperone HemW [Candidatus Edwardsbacteria bacterium]MBU1577407.1 radical SAM family heme chaperone HemW [Candidatus Edwardsbacteria bacterium]MBU2462791.1 radical SAM family heme chaperone HemW [Candidatus Edwardsbacteria bacterium]MBU2592974.1 radical SAM family heme chaperone HemW [Candidatus Edwardsbacteria bacterium]
MNNVYIHIPFCLAKCGYCGFNSRPLVSESEAGDYCQALMKEIANCKMKNDNLETVCFGGGTPSLLSATQLSEILGAVQEKFGPVSDGCETTIEANPGTVDIYKLSDLHEAGFNRLSLGVQSFDPDLLKLMGRLHNPEQAVKAFYDARQAGFRNISLDLIFALPGQGLSGWEDDLKKALELGPEHISLYSLTYEPETEFTRQKGQGRLTPAPEELEEEMYLAAIETMGSAGYAHYEVSNFARKNYRSRHNLNYWVGGDYLGSGAGAHSHIDGKRWSNFKEADKYISALTKGNSPAEMEENLTREQRIFEAIFLGLRMVEGIAVREFEKKWGIKPREYMPQVWRKLEENYYLEKEGGRVRLNIEGLLLSDTILADFAP